MATWEIHLFGRFRARVDERVLDDLATSKLGELLSYLLLHRDRPHSREALAEVLWGESPGGQSKKYLRQTLWQLQTALQPGGEQEGGLVVVEPEWVRLNLEADLWLDVEGFAHAHAATRGVSGEHLSTEQAALLEAAAALHLGDLLNGWYADWCLLERERFQTMYLTMLDKLMGYYATTGDYEIGLAHGESILRIDRAHERTHRQMMTLYALAGDRTAALRQYDRCVTALAEELSVKPARRTLALYEQVREDRIAPPTVSAVTTVGAGTSPSPPSGELSDHLRELRARLLGLEAQIRNEVRAIDSLLNP